MSMRSIVKSALFAIAVLSMSVAADNIGAWDPVEVGQNETQLLTKALTGNDLYDETVTTRVCYLEIHSIVSQVVSGTKYKYSVEGCKMADGVSSAGECGEGSANCVPTDFTVTVFDQPWTSTVKVLAIDAGATVAPAGSMAASNETVSAGSAESSNTTTTTTTPTTASKAPATTASTAPTSTPAKSSGASSLPGAALLVVASAATYMSL